ncbi:MAG: endo alpha-1,4 polygalactosaminidase [Vicinamibacteria bacterium]|nr:endo alpha-1,4 polygalactosaminidase [Vicinamibacteria bacterium]
MKWTLICVIAAALAVVGCGGADEDDEKVELLDPPSGPTPAWRPGPGLSWQWQLTGEIDSSVDAQVYNLDLFETDAATVVALHTAGRHVICYINVGAWEDWRPDRADFPAEIIGKSYDGWPGERWLDVRRIDLLAPVIKKRFDLCQAKGFDGIEPDNVDGYQQDTGFMIGAQDQIAYDRFLVTEAHARGLSIGLKNDPEHAATLVDWFDWALCEDCHADGWCDALAPFTAAGKAVFMAEYTDRGARIDAFCAKAKDLGFSGILKKRDLDAWRQACP